MNILFLGDSITDCGHCFTEDNLGSGYVKYISLFLEDGPSPTPLIINGGTEGFTFPRILQKWRQSYQDTPWDIAVLNGGINEVGYLMGTELPQESISQYLDRAMEDLHRLIASMLELHCRKILLVEPFLFPVPQYRRLWLPCLNELLRLIRRTVHVFSPGPVQLLPVQEALDSLALKQGMDAVTTDGIHLTDAGNQCLARLILPHLCL